jgi:membrane protein YqaA with SNARE-associated domain
MTDAQPDAQPPIVDGPLIRKMVVGIVVLLLVAGLCGLLLKEPIEALATAFVDRFGLMGLAAGVLITDSSIVPMTHEPFLLLGVSAGLPAMRIFGFAATASVVAGLLGWTLGHLLVGRTSLKPWVEGRWPTFAAFVRHYGARGVAVAALLPIPFAVATWSAGMMHVPLRQVALASLLRIPKTGFYLGLIVAGWSLGTS